MDLRRVMLAAVLSVAALGWVLPDIGVHGFWFDEAYTARLAVLDWNRLVAGAARDIHPPGWPLLAGVFQHLPISTEVALRLPAALGFAGLVGLIAVRNPVAGAALLLYAPLVEQAAQARPYVLLALGVVGLSRLLERRSLVAAGVGAGMVASLHALGGLLAVLVIAARIGAAPPGTGGRPRDWLRLAIPALLLTGWWIPSFASTTFAYLRAPWYTASSAGDWWILADAGGAALAAAIIVGSRAGTARVLQGIRELAVPMLVFGALAALDQAGVGVELRKTGLVLLPLLLATLGASRRDQVVALLAALALALTSARIPARPDLREAFAATRSLGPDVPVISVFASEAAWYLRDPAPIASYREPERIAIRIGEVLAAHGTDCVVSVALPDTFPSPSLLGPRLRTLGRAAVTGLDVRLVGTERCTLPVGAQGWAPPDPAP